MHKITVLTLVCLLGLPVLASSQSSEVPRAPIGRVVDLWVTKVEQIVVPAAESLPEASYGFVPTAGEFAGARTFADQVKHLAAANHQLAALALGEEPPSGTKNETAPASVLTKTDIIRYLKESFASLHRAAERINGRNVEAPIVVGKETQNGVGLIIDALTHSMDHYGQMVEYLRMNHVVPPASRGGS